MFEATFDSLKQFSCPQWFSDAKFGIWSHWGPQSVPMYGDWYARNMYLEGSPQYYYHIRHYGHPSKFGYKDLCKLWKAENFDPDYLMDLYYKAGARYFVGQAMHHDHFFNYDSKINPFNSVAMGPKKDICMLWQNAAKRKGLPFGLTEHLSASFTWWKTNKGCDKHGPYKGVPYDGNDPEYMDFYFDNAEHYDEKPEAWLWYTGNKKFHNYWRSVMEEVLDRFDLDFFYSDGALPFGDANSTCGDEIYKLGLEVVAKLYNKSIARYGENRAVYLQKDRRHEIYQVGILDIEKSQLPGINEKVWHTDTCIGNWFYDVREVYKKPEQIIEMLVDIVSKNGVMLLNILQKPDGSIDDETKYILTELADWFNICGEAIYSTRTYRVFSEGDTSVYIDGFTENKTNWNRNDFRFTRKENTIYAFIMNTPEDRKITIRSVEEKVKNVKLLGVGNVEFSQNLGMLTVKLPQEMPTKYTNCLAIEI